MRAQHAHVEPAASPHSPAPSLLPALWGLAGVCALLGSAIYRLAPLALEPLRDGSLTPLHGVLYGVSVLFNAYAEGYRGFQRAFSPRVVARAFHLARHPRPLYVALAPLYCLGFVHSTRKRKVVSGMILLFVVLAVTLVRRLDQPWRGIVDAGVVVGLGWGLLAIFVYVARALRGHPPDVALDLPGDGAARALPR